MGVQSYYFNQTRKAWTGFEYLPVTSAAVWHRDAQASTLRKVAGMALALILSIPLILYDLYRMSCSAIHAWRHPVAALPAPALPNAGQQQLVVTPHHASNTELLMQQVGEIPSRLIFSYVGVEARELFELTLRQWAFIDLIPRTETARSVTFQDMQGLDWINQRGAGLAFSSGITQMSFYGMSVPNPDEQVEQRIGHPRYVHVNTVYLGNSEGMTDRSAIAVATHFKERLTTLFLTTSYTRPGHRELPDVSSLHTLGNDASLNAIAKHCPQLNTLRLQDCPASEAALWNLVKSSIPGLRIFTHLGDSSHLSSRILQEIANRKTLEMLSIDNVRFDHSEGLKAVLANSPLTSVGINVGINRSRHTEDLSTELSRELSELAQRQGPALTHFWYKDGGSNELVSCLIEHCPNLSSIGLQLAPSWRRVGASFASIRNLIQARSATLEYLVVAGDMTNDQLLELIPIFHRCPKLQALGLADTTMLFTNEAITYETCFHLLKQCPSIRRFSLRHPFYNENRDRLRVDLPHVTIL